MYIILTREPRYTVKHNSDLIDVRFLRRCRATRVIEFLDLRFLVDCCSLNHRIVTYWLLKDNVGLLRFYRATLCTAQCSYGNYIILVCVKHTYRIIKRQLLSEITVK